MSDTRPPRNLLGLPRRRVRLSITPSPEYLERHNQNVYEALNHVSIIDPKRHNGAVTWFSPAECERYKERTTAERGNSRLKDEFGGRHVRVRGHAKVHMHVLFGLIALFADQILKPITG